MGSVFPFDTEPSILGSTFNTRLCKSDSIRNRFLHLFLIFT